MNPGISFDCVVVLPMAFARARVVLRVSGEVAREGMISTSCITGTGFIWNEY